MVAIAMKSWCVQAQSITFEYENIAILYSYTIRYGFTNFQ